MKTATIVRVDLHRFYNAVLCKLSEPYYCKEQETAFEYVVVSVTNKARTMGREHEETMIFGSNEHFEVPRTYGLASIDGMDRKACLAKLGYELLP